MQFQTRKPTGVASFPTILLAGVPGGGKTWAAVEASSWDKVDRTYFIELGEGMADEYGAVPGADFEIIEHDGTIGQVREAVRWASEQPVEDGKFPMLIIDSMTELWELITDSAQNAANSRAKRGGKRIPDEGVRVSIDLWNRASDTWNGIMRQVSKFPGPVILTARLDLVTLMDDKGQPTKAKDFKVQAQKKLPYQVTAVVEARVPRQWTMTKIATTVPELQLEPGGAMRFKEFTVQQLMEKMGVAAGMDATARQEPTPDDALSDEAMERAEQEALARAQAQQRESDLQAWHDSLLAFEKAGQVDQVRAGVNWARGKDREKFDMAQSTLDRIEENMPQAAPTPDEATRAVQDELDARPAKSA